MKTTDLLQTFGKGKISTDKATTTKNAVIYTRVSSKEQADTNQSLETQKKYCLQYALKHRLFQSIAGIFIMILWSTFAILRLRFYSKANY